MYLKVAVGSPGSNSIFSGINMLLLSILLTIWLASFQIADSNKRIEPVKMNFFCVNGKLSGKHRSTAPILLIHGVTSSINGWDGVYQNLTRRINKQICLIDLRNHGDSPRSNRVDVRALTADVENFLREQKIKRVHLIGHSLGGKVAMNLALRNKKRVSSLVVEDMRPNNITDEGLSFVRNAVALYREVINEVPVGSSEEEARQIIADEIEKAFEEMGVDEKINKDQLEIREVNGKWEWKFNLDVISEALEDPDEFLGTIKGKYLGPTLFIYGTASPMDVKGDEKNIKKMFPNAELVPIEGAGHNIHGNFIQFEDEIVEFFNEM